MRVLRVVVVIRTIEVGWHDRDIVGAVLTIEVLAILETRDLSQGVCLIGLLQLAGKQAALLHGLRREAGVDAAGAEEEEFLAAILPSRVDDVHLHDHVVVHEVGESRLVGDDAADLGGGEENVVWFLSGEERLYGFLAAEVKLGMGASDEVGVTLALQFAHDSRAHHPAVSCDVYFRFFFHTRLLLKQQLKQLYLTTLPLATTQLAAGEFILYYFLL